MASFSFKNMNDAKEAEDFINLGIVLNEKREVLMIRRVEKETGKNGSVLEWAFPGGKQRYNESRADCVKREILDETGYDISVTKENLSMRLHPQFPIFIVYHLCRINPEKLAAEPQEPHEVAEIKWVRKSELKNLITTDLDEKVAKELGIK